MLENPQRWNDEDWWLDRRVHDWCAVLRQAGRDLFGKQSDSVSSMREVVLLKTFIAGLQYHDERA